MGCRKQSATSNVQNNHLCTFVAEGSPRPVMAPTRVGKIWLVIELVAAMFFHSVRLRCRMPGFAACSPTR